MKNQRFRTIHMISTAARLTLGGALLSMAIPSAMAASPLPSGKFTMIPQGRHVSDANIGLEMVAYSEILKELVVINAETNSLDFVSVDPADAGKAARSVTIDPTQGKITSVAVHQDLIAVTQVNALKTDPGKILFFNLKGDMLHSLTVGYLPDMLLFAADGKKILIANEGEPSDDYLTDPNGSLGIVDLAQGAAKAKYRDYDFSAFNAGGPRHHELPPGLRIFPNAASIAQDLEPEYVALSPEGDRAYVTLQEANAVAIFNILQDRFESIVDLGLKDHSLAGNKIDASDKDGGINRRNWPIFGMYMPDAIASFKSGGKTFIVTANEGDTRDYPGYSEEARVMDLKLDPAAFPDAAALQKPEALGRLKVTASRGDENGDGLHERLYNFGGRSFSIRDAAGRLVFDSGDWLDEIIAGLHPRLFNSEGSGASFDTRSDDKGAEPEGLTVGQVDGRTILFLGLERTSGVMAFDITVAAKPVFLNYVRAPYGDIAPEGFTFIPAAANPLGQPMLGVANEVSGSLTWYAVGFN